MPVEPAHPPSIAVEVWNMMGGLDWHALPVVCEMFGISDVDELVRDLVTIREFNRA